MGYRIFRDSRGTEWQTWDVVPRLSDRRVSDRRGRVGQPAHSERRLPRDRRVSVGPRPALFAGLEGGWLCFEAQTEKRRLTPIPADWLQCALERLEQYCAQATRTRASISIRDPLLST